MTISIKTRAQFKKVSVRVIDYGDGTSTDYKEFIIETSNIMDLIPQCEIIKSWLQENVKAADSDTKMVEVIHEEGEWSYDIGMPIMN
jgi:hypothetical protein